MGATEAQSLAVADPAQTPTPAAAYFERVSVIGASQSAGFGEGVPFHRVLRAALADGPSVFDASSSAHFVDAITVGQTQVLASRLRRPTLVIAVDFLFWYAHGVKPFEQRVDDLREGMALLETIGAPMLVGDLPDVSGASERMISRSQIPSRSELARLNEEIAAWAGERETVIVLPLGAWMASLGEQTPVSLWGRPATMIEEDALQWDGLHPTPRGQALLVLLVLQEFERAYGKLGPLIRIRDLDALAATFAQPEESGSGAAGTPMLPPPPGSAP